MKKIRKVLSFISALALIWGQILAPSLILAQDATSSSTPVVDVSPSPQPSPTGQPSPTPAESPQPTITPSPSPEVSPQLSTAAIATPSATPAPTADASPSPTPGQTPVPNPSESPVGQPNSPPPSASPSASPDVSTPSVHGNLSVAVLHNNQSSSAPKLDLNPVNQTSSATLTTDKKDYSPTDTAIISGSGFSKETGYTLEITSSDPPAVDFKTQITTDIKGSFTYSYQLDGNYRPNYQVYVKGYTGEVIASTTFTDSQTVNSVTVNGGSSATVAPNSSITTAVTVTLSVGTNWKSTQYTIQGQNPVCVDTTDHTLNGQFTESFPITVPTTPGTYDLSVTTFSNNSCNGSASTPKTLTGGIIVNASPVANNQSVTTDEDTNKAITLTATDAEGSPLTYAIVTNPAHGIVNGGTGAQRTYTPAQDYNGPDSFTFKANDGISDSNTATVSITVNPVNDPPSFDAISNQTINEDASTQNVPITNVSSGPSDESGQTISLTATSNNPLLVPNPTVSGSGATRTLTYAPVTDASGQATITVTAQDSGGVANGGTDTFSRTFTITVIANSHITIVKNAITNNAQDFTFHDNFGNSNLTTFLLDDDGNEADALPKSRNFEVLPGSYSVSEDQVAGWKLSSSTCDNGSSVDNINVSTGQTVTCTFTNKKLGTIVLVKNTVGGDGTFDFDMTGTNLPPNTQLTTSSNTASQTFNGIDPDDTYSINETAPGGWNLTSVSCVQSNGTVKPNTGFTIATGATVTCTFTNTKLGSISGSKFIDTDGNGVWDGNEVTEDGWRIALSGGPNNTDQESFTGDTNEGEYLFENLLPGTYQVCEDIVSSTGDNINDWTQTTPGDNFHCPDGTKGYEIKLSAGQKLVNQDFGNFRKITISGRKFEDMNADGFYDPGDILHPDHGLSNWTIFMDQNNNGVFDNSERATTTDPDGNYSFTDVGPGTYKIREVQQNGWRQTTNNPTDIVAQSGNNVSGIDFGNFHKVIITGLKWEDLNADGKKDDTEPGLGGSNIDVSKVTPATEFSTEMVQLQLTSQTASDSGQFTATVDRPGTYRLTEQTQSNFQKTWPTDSFFDVFVDFSGQTTGGQTSITQDKNGHPLRFGNAPFQQLSNAKFVPTSGNGGSTTSIVVLGDSTISVSSGDGTSSVFLPGGTIITKSGGGTIDVSKLSAQAPTIGDLKGFDTNTVVDGAMQWGIPDLGLEFSQAITLHIFVGTVLNGKTLNVVRSSGLTGPWVSTGIVDPATCLVSAGICTFQATKASYYATTHTSSTTSSTSSSTSGGGGGDGLGCAVHDCSTHPAPQNLSFGISPSGGNTAGFTPGVLGVSTPNQENVGIGEKEKDQGQVQGEATANSQQVSSPTPEPQTAQGSSPFNIKVIVIITILLLSGFGIFRFFVK